MTIQLDLEHRQLSFLPAEQALAKAAASRNAMRFQFHAQLASKQASYIPVQSLKVEENTLKRMIGKYSEQLVYQPMEELQNWFTYSSGAFLDPGYPSLYYSRSEQRQVCPNKSAIAGIGEGIAGLVMQQRYRCRQLCRPYHDYPDIVMEKNGKIYLVEAKATTLSVAEVQQVIDEELIRLVAYCSACAELDGRPVMGVLVGTALVSETVYHCSLTEVEMQ